MKLRGVVALLAVTLGMVLCDLVQRLLIGPLVWLMPSSRKRILGAWMQAMAWLTSRPMVFLGGASIAVPPQVPFEPGVLIIMNHQSLLDIPMVCSSVRGGYPLIVTRKRYRHWIPLISHMIRLYQYPVVDPTANRRDALGMTDELSEVARTAEVPVAIFPEGTRTRDGDIGRFKKAGLRRILQVRAWRIRRSAAFLNRPMSPSLVLVPSGKIATGTSAVRAASLRSSVILRASCRFAVGSTTGY